MRLAPVHCVADKRFCIQGTRGQRLLWRLSRTEWCRQAAIDASEGRLLQKVDGKALGAAYPGRQAAGGHGEQPKPQRQPSSSSLGSRPKDPNLRIPESPRVDTEGCPPREAGPCWTGASAASEPPPGHRPGGLASGPG